MFKLTELQNAAKNSDEALLQAIYNNFIVNEDLANKHGRRIPLRLVKGAYWDSEIKTAQQLGIEAYPVVLSR